MDPLEWWDPHWLKDQVEGVWARAGARGGRGGGESKPVKDQKKTSRAKGKAAKGKKPRN